MHLYLTSIKTEFFLRNAKHIFPLMEAVWKLNLCLTLGMNQSH